MPLVAAVLVVGAAGAWIGLHRRGPKILPSASRIAVLPLTPSVADTGLNRLGRDLVLTVSANLDAVGEVRTVDPYTILAQAGSASTGVSLPEAAAIGRRFGAGSVIQGTVVRLGPQLVRLEFGLFTSDSLAPVLRATVTASPDSVALLSDSITRAVLQHIWRRGEPPTPSLDAALKTRSAPALRAFLEGERALVENRWADAAEAYASAISADSTFWLPYWRYAFSRGYWEGNDIDSTIVKAFETHRSELPPADRLSIESSMAFRDSLLDRARQSRRGDAAIPGLLVRLAGVWRLSGALGSDSRPQGSRGRPGAGARAGTESPAGPGVAAPELGLLQEPQCDRRDSQPRGRLGSAGSWTLLGSGGRVSMSCCSSDCSLDWRKRAARPIRR